MEGPDVGPGGRVDPWIRAARAPEPLPAPPAGYRFAAPDYLYAPPEQTPDTVHTPDALHPPDAWPSARQTAPVMVWSAATSTWEPAPRPTAGPLPPPTPRPSSRSAWVRWSRRLRSSRRLRRRRRRSPTRAVALAGCATLVAGGLVVAILLAAVLFVGLGASPVG